MNVDERFQSVLLGVYLDNAIVRWMSICRTHDAHLSRHYKANGDHEGCAGIHEYSPVVFVL